MNHAPAAAPGAAVALGDRIRVPRSAVRVGVARRDVTPPVGIRAKNWGPAEWERSEGVHRPFTLTALALSGGDDRQRVLLAVEGCILRGNIGRGMSLQKVQDGIGSKYAK